MIHPASGVASQIRGSDKLLVGPSVHDGLNLAGPGVKMDEAAVVFPNVQFCFQMKSISLTLSIFYSTKLGDIL